MYTPTLPTPPPLRGEEAGSFAESSITQRLPRIAQRVLAENTLPSSVANRIEAFMATIPHGLIQPFPETNAPDMPGWQHHVTPYLDHNWLQVPWFFAETYFYRYLIAIVDFFRTGLDPFAYQKHQGLQTTLVRSRALAVQLQHLLADGWHPESVMHLLTLALWGNQADLSLWAADDVTQPSHTDTDSQQAHLLVNDAEAVAHYLTTLPVAQGVRPVRVDCLLDNAGLELLGDLCLTDYLLSTGQVHTVQWHLKLHPTFVSDAMIADVHATLVFLANDTDAALQTLVERLQRFLTNGRWQLHTHPFWTSPLPMWEMPDDLRQALAGAHLVISKGDANYRRALGDAHWPFTTPFADVVSYFPAPIVFLRTCKAEVIAGLSSAQVHDLMQRDPEWLSNGKWGVMQFVREHVRGSANAHETPDD
jgi:uncharacterized protein with ATP-grasp and redox domains